jgi:hypothetical protein
MSGDAFRDGALVLGLQKLFANPFFSVCQVETLVKLAGVSLTKEESDVFHALHCVNYGDMPPGYKRVLFEKVVAVLRRRPEVSLEWRDLERAIEFPAPVRPEASAMDALAVALVSSMMQPAAVAPRKRGFWESLMG